MENYIKVGNLDGNTLVRKDDVLYKVIAGELTSDDLWGDPLDCFLIVEYDSDQPIDVSIGGMSRNELPDGFVFEFTGNNGEQYEGQLYWG